MITSDNQQTILDEPWMSNPAPSIANEPSDAAFTLSQTAETSLPSNHLLLRNKFILHHPKAGLNPLVDAAAYLFSIIGKLKALKSYQVLQKLHKELIAEINTFQETAKNHGYTSEYILVSRYALCATLDDIIGNTPWGNQGQWDSFSLLTVFNQESAKQERFFLILERIIKDPSLYIDVMEFMYICLSLGYKGSYRSTEFSHHQLEKITHALYKRIRAYHGDFSKALSPPSSLKPILSEKIKPAKLSVGFTLLMTICIIMVLFIGLGFLLDTISNQAYQALSPTGKSTSYETRDHQSL